MGGGDKIPGGVLMVKSINGTTNFRMFTSWKSLSKFQIQAGRVTIGLIGKERSIIPYLLALDSKITRTQTERIMEWLKEGAVTTEKLRQIAPTIENLSDKMADVKIIAISPNFKISRIKTKGLKEIKTLALNLEAVLREVQKFEEEKAKRILLDRKTILDEVGPGTTAGGTLLDTSYQRRFAGEELFEIAAKRLFPLKVTDLQKQDGFGFYDEIVNRLGRKRIGRYEPEFAIAREMALRGQPIIPTLVSMIGALKGDRSPGEALTLELRKVGADYLNELEGKLRDKVQSRCSRLYRILLGTAMFPNNQIRPEVRESLAILTLGIYAKKLSRSEAVLYLKRESGQALDNRIDDFLTEVRNYLKTEDKEKRIFSLRLVINILGEIAKD